MVVEWCVVGQLEEIEEVGWLVGYPPDTDAEVTPQTELLLIRLTDV